MDGSLSPDGSGPPIPSAAGASRPLSRDLHAKFLPYTMRVEHVIGLSRCSHRRTFLRIEPWRPSICGTSKLCRWVVTHSFRVADLHGHRPDVFIHSHPPW